MLTEDVWAQLQRWSETVDDRGVSDEARRWANEEAGRISRPETRGEWIASMMVAFEAGRVFECMALRGRQ